LIKGSLMIYGYWAIPGLFLAHLVTSFYNDTFVTFNIGLILIAIKSIFCVPLSAIILKRLFINLRIFFIPSYLISLTLLSAFINASLANLIQLNTRADYNLERFFPEFFGYLIGDTFGVLLVLIGYIGIRRLFYLSIEEKKYGTRFK